MRYMGGKGRLAGRLSDFLIKRHPDATRYLEPFVGAGFMLERMAPEFETVRAGELNEDLVLLWAALRSGWEPPAALSREEYRALRDAPPSALRAFAGFGCSFGGKWFGGYAANKVRPTGKLDDYAGAARRGLIRKAQAIGQVEVARSDYRDWEPVPGEVVYCDPPYAGTTAYGGMDAFDATIFWKTMTTWAAVGAHVYVSEYTAPEDVADVAWQASAASSLRRDDNATRVTEKLFRVKPGV